MPLVGWLLLLLVVVVVAVAVAVGWFVCCLLFANGWCWVLLVLSVC